MHPLHKKIQAIYTNLLIYTNNIVTGLLTLHLRPVSFRNLIYFIFFFSKNQLSFLNINANLNKMWKFLLICVVMSAFNSEADAASGKLAVPA